MSNNMKTKVYFQRYKNKNVNVTEIQINVKLITAH